MLFIRSSPKALQEWPLAPEKLLDLKLWCDASYYLDSMFGEQGPIQSASPLAGEFRPSRWRHTRSDLCVQGPVGTQERAPNQAFLIPFALEVIEDKYPWHASQEHPGTRTSTRVARFQISSNPVPHAHRKGNCESAATRVCARDRGSCEGVGITPPSSSAEA